MFSVLPAPSHVLSSPLAFLPVSWVPHITVFFRKNLPFATVMTKSSGIRQILPKSEICDFDFGHCGYSMNAIKGPAISTIHVTQEDGFFQAVGYDPKAVNYSQMLERVLSCFNRAEFSVAIHSESLHGDLVSEFSLDLRGYMRLFKGGGRVSPRSTLKCCWSEYEKEEEVEEK